MNHRTRTFPFYCLFLFLFPLFPAAGAEPPVHAWWVDSLKQLLTTDPAGTGEVEGCIHAAWGEVESIQLALRADRGLRVRVLDGAGFNEALRIRVRRVGRVPVRRGTPRTPPEEKIAPPPADLPDPLFPETELRLEPNRTESFWLDLEVPRDAQPGTYRTLVSIMAGEEKIVLPLVLEVHEAVVPFECSLGLTNWFVVKPEAMGFGKVAPGDEAWWRCADLLFDDMWSLRQNMFWTPLREPWIRPRVGKDGALVFDFSFFDRWVEAFSRPRGGARKTYIEGQPIASRKGYDGVARARVWRVKGDGVESVLLDPGAPEAREGYRIFLGALRDHLKERGWLDRFRIHITDEPHGEQLKAYAVLAGYVRAFAPEFSIMEALDVKDDYVFFSRHCDVWVPQLGRFDRSLALLRERMKQGKEVWFYTCLFPNGRYPNRLVDYPLVKTRVLPWIAFGWGFSGFLHWGFDHWRGDPFKELEPPHGKSYLPPGDAWIVYPGKKAVIDSIRYEAFRDGVEDYELLKALSAKDPEAARALVKEVVPSFTGYVRDPARFRAARRRLLDALEVPARR